MSRAAVALVALGLVVGSPAAGWASGLELRLGAFFPRAQSNLFDDVNELFTPDSRADECTQNFCPGVQQSDWIGLYGGGEYSFNLARQVEMGFRRGRLQPGDPHELPRLRPRGRQRDPAGSSAHLGADRPVLPVLAPRPPRAPCSRT